MTAAQPKPHASWLKPFESLENANFRYYWLGTLVSSLGTRLQSLALAWLVLKLTGSSLALGLVLTVESIPILLFSLFGGAMADRLPKRRILLATQSVMLVQALALGILSTLGLINIWTIYVLVAIVGLVQAIDMPTSQSFVEELVGSDKETLANASELTSTLFNMTKVAGPALGGIIVAAIGEEPAFYLNAVSFFGVLGALLVIDKRKLFPAKARPVEKIQAQIKAGLAYAIRTVDIVSLLLLLGALGLFGYNLGVLMPLIAKRILDSGPAGLGMLSAALGVGSLAASLLIDVLGLSTRRLVLVGAVAFTLALLSVSLFDGWYLALPLTALLGFSSVMFLATANARLQVLVDEEFRSQLMSVYTILIFGTTPVGSLMTGALVDRIGVRETAAALAVLCGLGLVATFVYMHRKRDQLVPDTMDAPIPRAEAALRRHMHLPWLVLHR
ncbi:MAG: MFS transporter [Dehalococcoidia bacterium]